MLLEGPYGDLSSINSQDDIDHLNIYENDTTTFLTLNMKIGWLIECVKDKEVTCVIENQVRHDTNKKDIHKQDIEQDIIGRNNTDVNMNPYYKTMTNKVRRKMYVHHKWNTGLY